MREYILINCTRPEYEAIDGPGKRKISEVADYIKNLLKPNPKKTIVLATSSDWAESPAEILCKAAGLDAYEKCDWLRKDNHNKDDLTKALSKLKIQRPELEKIIVFAHDRKIEDFIICFMRLRKDKFPVLSRISGEIKTNTNTIASSLLE